MLPTKIYCHYEIFRKQQVIFDRIFCIMKLFK